jgi:hypothetical protein
MLTRLHHQAPCFVALDLLPLPANNELQIIKMLMVIMKTSFAHILTTPNIHHPPTFRFPPPPPTPLPLPTYARAAAAAQ